MEAAAYVPERQSKSSRPVPAGMGRLPGAIPQRLSTISPVSASTSPARQQPTLGFEDNGRRNARTAHPRNHCRIRPAAQKGRVLRWEVKDSALTPSDGINHAFMFGVDIGLHPAGSVPAMNAPIGIENAAKNDR